MQVDRLNHLLFPPDSAPVSSGKDRAPGTAIQGRGPAHAHPSTPAVENRTEHQKPGVVLKLQTKDGHGVPAADASVYSDARKTQPVGAEVDADAHRAELHQQALHRNAGVINRMSVDKDGVLVVSKPQTPASEAGRGASDDFVSMAVSSMRKIAEDAARAKAEAIDAEAAQPASKLKGLQHLAARFNLFA